MKQADMWQGAGVVCARPVRLSRIGGHGQGVKGKQVQTLANLVTVNRSGAADAIAKVKARGVHDDPKAGKPAGCREHIG